MNRLRLDFTLESAEERAEFINRYIETLDGLTQKELTTIANYLLWGKKSDGTAVGADLNLETKWSREENAPDSLESVLESPSASHIYIRGLNEATVYKKPRVVFSREEARKNAPDCVRLLKIYGDRLMSWIWRLTFTKNELGREVNHLEKNF